MDTVVTILIVLALVIAFILFATHLYTRLIASKVVLAAPKTGKETRVRGGTIHWVEKGAGPPIVMIHGLGGNYRHFDYALMGRLASKHRVIALDRPGCGYSTRDSAAFAAIPEQARMIAEFLDKEGIEKPVVVGHSLGGAISLALALDHPDHVGALALLAPLTQPASEPPDVFKPLMVGNAFMRTLIAQTLSTPMGIWQAKAALEAVFAPDPVPEDFAIRAGGVLSLRPQGFIAPSEDITAVPGVMEGITARLPQLTVGGGVLYGTDDRILDAETHGRGLASAAPGIALELIEGVGHMLPITQPERCAAFIEGVAKGMTQSAA